MMAGLADKIVQRGVALFIGILVVLVGGTFLAINLTTSHLVNEDARSTAREWAQFIAANVTDLKQIASGETPSSATMDFLGKAKNARRVSRYVIYNSQGYSQFIASREMISSVDLSEYNPDAIEAVVKKQV
ncbi:MAG: GGDEF-domain containing protein, partial [Hyphomicrobiales bacterium]|nr:GGDEF-domain containing protein [Hyphomicrobiales bacterium]